MATEKGKRRKLGRSKGKLYGKRPPDNPAQYKRFVEAAKKLGADDRGEEFNKALDKILPKKPIGGS